MIAMGSPKVKPVLERLGQDIRNARLRRSITVADFALRAGTSSSSIARLEKGDPGVALGTLANVLLVLGIAEGLADLVDVRKDDLGLALANEQLPQRARSFAARLRAQKAKPKGTPQQGDVIDLDGVSF